MSDLAHYSDDAAVELAYDLIQPYVPPNGRLTITETDGRMISRYLIRITYMSQRTGRKMSTLAKGDKLPCKEDNTLAFYLNQIILSPKEIGAEFSRIAFLERRAKQDAWLAAGKLANDRVASEESAADMIPLSYNEEGATQGF